MDIINTSIVAEAIFFNTYHFKFGKNNMDNTPQLTGKKAKLNNLYTKACLIYVKLLLIN